MCKPSSCCGKHHKHYVMNTESMEGVCVRHNDDCTSVCMPRGNEHPHKPRVCSKVMCLCACILIAWSGMRVSDCMCTPRRSAPCYALTMHYMYVP
jgi:hypothetical protein